MLQPVGNFLCGLHVSYKNISQKFENIKSYQIGIQQRWKYSKMIYIQKLFEMRKYINTSLYSCVYSMDLVKI